MYCIKLPIINPYTSFFWFDTRYLYFTCHEKRLAHLGVIVLNKNEQIGEIPNLGVGTELRFDQ